MRMRRRKRKMFGSGLAAAAVVLVVASTAYACVQFKGTATVTGTVRVSNLMRGSGVHGYCTGGGPVTAAAGPTSSTVSASFARSTTGCVNQLSQGTYDVKLRNTTAGFTGTDGTGWTMGADMGCFSGVSGGTIYPLGTMSVGSTGSGSGSWTVPSGASSNGVNDASVFCVGNQTLNGDGTKDGFLAPFRVSTV